MDHHVLRQRLFDAKGLVALRTPVGFLTCGVGGESGGAPLACASAPSIAGTEGFLTGVGPEVHLQAGLAFEFLLANVTLMHGRFVPAKEPR